MLVLNYIFIFTILPQLSTVATVAAVHVKLLSLTLKQDYVIVVAVTVTTSDNYVMKELQHSVTVVIKSAN